MHFIRTAILALAMATVFTAPLIAQDAAHFRIGKTPITQELAPFTATINRFGNGAKLTREGGFEPTVLRTTFRATQDAQNTIHALTNDITAYDTWAEGAFDGAEIEVLRIVNGVMTSVRTSKVAKGGYNASGWIGLDPNKMAPSTNYNITWKSWNRLDVPYYFTVKAVDSSGRLSEAAQSVSIVPQTASPKQTSSQALKIVKLDLKDQASLDAPQNLKISTSNELAQLSWSPVSGAAGYVVYRSDTPPHLHQGYSIELADNGAAIRNGDMIILRHKIYTPDHDMITNRVWNVFQATRLIQVPLVKSWPDAVENAEWSLTPHGTSTKVPGGGETFLRAKLSRDRSLKIGLYNNSGTNQDWYDVLDPKHTYYFDVWLRGTAGLSAKFVMRGPSKLPSRSIRLTSGWKQHRIEFQVPETYAGTGVSWMGLELSGTGVVSVDNFRVYRSDAPYLGFTPEDTADIQNSKMAALRTHGLIKTGLKTYDLTQLTGAAGSSSVANGNTLPQALNAFEDVDVQPWLQIEPHMSRDEWLGLVEFLAAPFDPLKDTADTKPMAAKRASQGHLEPYTDTFDMIHFEIGNETWNNLFRPWVFKSMRDAETGQQYTKGAVYGLYQHHVLSIMKSSPYWDALVPKLTPVLGGWTINSYGHDAAELSTDSTLVTHAEYNGGWDQGEGPVEPTQQGFESVLSFAVQTAQERSAEHFAIAQSVAQKRGAPLKVGTYEAGPGYTKNGLNGAKVTAEQANLQEQVMKSAAAGTATLDTFLMQARQGYTTQNYFTFSRGLEWSSHAKWYNGGHAYPAWQWLSLINEFADSKTLGQMFDVETLTVPMQDIPALKRREARNDAPMVDVYPFLSESQLSLILISRRIPNNDNGTDSITDVTIELPISSSKSLTRYTMSGNYKSHNLKAPNARIKREDLKAPGPVSKLHITGLKPGSAQVFIFDGIEP